jgi:predicted regulator of Ras-like GTPase activity (Roadblock/LC7/MglB family)
MRARVGLEAGSPMMSIFAETLEGIAKRVEGVRGVSLIGRDGIPLESLGGAGESALEPVATEITGILKHLMTEESGNESGDIQQFTIESGGSILVLVAVTSEYYLMVLLSRDGNSGRARFEARRAAASLEKELV